MRTITLPDGQQVLGLDKTTAIYVFEEIYRDHVYTPPEITIHSGDIIFDVGANIGLFSRFIASQATNLRIFAFEPIPQNFTALEANLTGIPASVTPYMIGLGDREADVVFDFYPRVSADSAAEPPDWDFKVDKYVEHYNATFVQFSPILRLVPRRWRKSFVRGILRRIYRSEKVTCHLRTLSAIIAENAIDRIDFLKIDAENYEAHVLAGIVPHDWPKIRQVAIEVHTHIKNGQDLVGQCTTLLQGNGFRTFPGKESRETILGVYMLYGIRP